MARPMNRRDFVRLLSAGGAAASLGSVVFSQEPKKARPNVLFIAIDDMNDWIGCLGGHPDTKTPHLDALAQRGVNFTSAHCAAPLCNASRAALMTGVRPSTSGVYTNGQPFRQVLPEAVTLAQHFMAHDYRVMGSGKIYHGRFPDPPSWHEYWPSQTQNRPADPMPPNRPLNGIPKTAHFDWGPVQVPDEEMGDHQVASWVIEQLEQDHDKPFFLACGIFRPHLPWYVPQKYFDMFPPEEVTLPNINENDLDDVPPMGVRVANPNGDHRRVIESNNWRKAVSGYLASIAFADAQVGRVIGALDESPYADNTIVVVWSDHGWHLGEKLHWRKFALWEEATHNVLMMVAPGVAKAGARCSRPVNLMDIYPTLIDLCDLEPREDLEAVSLLPLLKRPKAEWDRPALTTHKRNNHSVRSERWRYIRYSDGTEELYDHEKDELEWTNLADKPKYARTKKRLARWLPEVNAENAPTAGKTP
ncbi:MAG: sulfatase [Armatimonadota bacterium]